jgi:cation/acetate symporter
MSSAIFLPVLAVADGASVQTLTYIFVSITFALYLYIGWRSRVRESQGFYVAGKGVPAIANGAATAADWMSAASFISMAGLISFAGSNGSMYLMGWTGGYVLLALLLAPYLRKYGQYTVPDFVGARYNSETARVVAAIAAVFISLTYVAGQMKGVGLVFSRFLEVDLTIGVIVGMIIVAVFAVLGGMKGITWTQVVQYFVLIVAFLVPAVAISKILTGYTVPQFALIFSDLANELDAGQQALGFDRYTQPFTGGLDQLNVLFITASLMFGTAGLPHVIVRFYTVSTVRAARWSAFWALLFIAILYTTAPALAMFARKNLLDSLHQAKIHSLTVISGNGKADVLPIEGRPPTEIRSILKGITAHNARVTEQVKRMKAGESIPAQQLLVAKSVHYKLKDKQGKEIGWASSWQAAGLMSFEDKDGDGRIQINAYSPDPQKPAIKAFKEAKIDRDIIVIATPEVAGLPAWVIALVATGGLAAALSTAAGLLLVISSSLAHDLYIHFRDPEADEAKRLKVARIMILLAIIVAGYFGINPPGFVGEVVAFAFGLAAASFFPAILLGIFDKRTNGPGAIAGMIVGLSFTGIYILGNSADKVFPLLFDEPQFGRWFFGISPQGIGTVGMLINFAVTLVVSRLTPPPSQEIQDLVESIRIPRGRDEARTDQSDAKIPSP